MAFEIVNETYTVLDGQDPKRFGYIKGYTSNTVGATYLRLNVKSIPDEEMYECYKRSKSLQHFEYKVGQVYGEGIRLSKRQVWKLIWELFKWLIRGW